MNLPIARLSQRSLSKDNSSSLNNEVSCDCWTNREKDINLKHKMEATESNSVKKAESEEERKRRELDEKERREKFFL